MREPMTRNQMLESAGVEFENSRGERLKIAVRGYEIVGSVGDVVAVRITAFLVAADLSKHGQRIVMQAD